MMTDTDPKTEFPWVRKLLVPMLGGALVGGLGSYALLTWIDSDAVGGLPGSAVLAALVGGFYLVIGVSVGLGTLSPGVGARFLNVEDADELREQRRVLVWSAAGMALWGASLLALALAAPDGPLPGALALVIGIAGLLGGSACAWASYRAADELMLAVNLEAGSITYRLVLLVVGGWAMLAHLGHLPAPLPLDLLTSFHVLVLVATFIAVGRRGMLKLR